MKATYKSSKPGISLRVRKQPSASAPVVRLMQSGTVDAEEVVKGWVKIADGYIDARFVTVTDGDPEADGAKPEAEKPAEEKPEAVEDTPEETDGEPEADGDEEARARLKKMTNPQLYKLAEESGIKVAKGSTKAELIDAILNGADE